MTVGAVKPFTITMPTGTTLTSALDLSGSFGKLLLGIPTMTSGTDIFIQASDSASGTFRRIYYPGYVDTATPAVLQLNSSITNCYLPVDANAQFLKIEFTTAASDSSHTFKILASTN